MTDLATTIDPAINAQQPDRIAPVVDVYLDPSERLPALRRDVRTSLSTMPKQLAPKWFYDDRGSDLFDQITRLDEYYPTECERSILKREAASLASITRADTLVELGSGTSDKTRVILDAMWLPSATSRSSANHRRGQLKRYVPFDVSEGILRSSSKSISQRYRGLIVHGVVGDFDRHLEQIAKANRRSGPPPRTLTALLGGTIGNFQPAARHLFLKQIVQTMQPGDWFLLGTDLVKDRRRLVNAYDDASGVTAAFNKNVLGVMNRELGANFNLENFEHVALFDEQNEWIEMRLRSVVDQQVFVRDLDLHASFGAGEEMRTEVSAKFTRPRVVREMEAVGLSVKHWWTDQRDDYALSLSQFCA